MFEMESPSSLTYLHSTPCSSVLHSSVLLGFRSVPKFEVLEQYNSNLSRNIHFSRTAESLGVSAKLGPGALWGSHPARFHEVPRFQVGVPSKGSGRFRGSQEGFEIKDSGGSKVPRKTF